MTDPGSEEGDDTGVAESPDGAGDAALEPSAAPSVPPGRAGRQPVARAEGPAEPVLQVLPLGSGLVLIGLGLGLAFVGLRLRRG
jgi:hypothetical protein